MPLWSLLFAITAFSSTALLFVSQHESSASKNGEAKAIAGNMCVIRNALISYSNTHPSATGAVGIPMLTDVPSWFVAMRGVQAHLDGSRPLVYLNGTAPIGLVSELRTCGKLVYGDVPVGVTKAGKLVDGSSGNTVLTTVPASIPEGVVVVARF